MVWQNKGQFIFFYFCGILPFNQKVTLQISLSYTTVDTFSTKNRHKTKQKHTHTHPKKQPNKNHTHTQKKTQSRMTLFCPHGFILPIHCRVERLQYSLGISKASKFFLRVSKTKFNKQKPCSATQTLD